VEAIHLGNQVLTLSNYNFLPGYIYTLTITGSGTATGNLSNPGASDIYLGVSLGEPITSSYFTQTCTPFPDYANLLSFSEAQTYSNALGFSCDAQLDLTSPFLTNVVAIGEFPNSSTASTIALKPFTVTSASTGLNIESYPVLGNEPGITDITPIEDLINNLWVVPYPATTTTTLTINSVNISQTPYITTTPLINGTTVVSFSESKTFATGIITAPPGSLVTVTLSAFGGKPNKTTIVTNCSLTTPGVTFTTTGTNIVSATNGDELTGSTTTSFYMPSTGFVNWTGNISGENAYGSGAISVK
jgi:hypothetical protein